MAEDTWFRKYSEIQDRVDNLYNTEWFQSNACFPTIFFYTDENDANSEFTVDKFLTLHLPKGETFIQGKNDNSFIKTDDKPDIVGFNDKGLKNGENTIKSYMEYEQQLKGSGVTAEDCILRQFSKVSGLKNYSIPLSKKNNALTKADERTESSTITLEFLNDKDFKVLYFLRTWQSRWYSNTYQKKALASKFSSGDKKGGEGYLGLANCSIDIDGNITINSHLSLFGLIPKRINTPTDFGPGTSPSGVSKISVECLYSHIILVYPRGMFLDYYYYA